MSTISANGLVSPMQRFYFQAMSLKQELESNFPSYQQSTGEVREFCEKLADTSSDPSISSLLAELQPFYKLNTASFKEAYKLYLSLNKLHQAMLVNATNSDLALSLYSIKEGIQIELISLVNRIKDFCQNFGQIDPKTRQRDEYTKHIEAILLSFPPELTASPAPVITLSPPKRAAS